MPQDGRPYYTSEELAFRLKSEHPELREIDNATLVREVVARRPEVAEQIVDFDNGAAGGPSIGAMNTPRDLEDFRADQTAGSRSSEQFQERYPDTKTTDVLKGVGKSVANTAHGVLSLVGGGNVIPQAYREPNRAERPSFNMGNAAQFMAPSGAARLLAIPALQKAPWLVRMLAGAVPEGAKAAGIAKLQGQTDRGIMMEGAVGAAGGAMLSRAPNLRSAARENIVRAFNTPPNRQAHVQEIAEDAIEDGIIGTSKSLKETVEGRKKAAGARIQAMEEDPTPTWPFGVSRNLREKAQREGLAVPDSPEAFDLHLMRSEVYRLEQQGLSRAQAIERVAKDWDLPPGFFEPTLPLRETQSVKNLRENPPPLAQELRGNADELDDLTHMHKGYPPFGQLLRLRQTWQGVYNRSPLAARPAPTAQGGMLSKGALNEGALHENTIPGRALKSADRQYEVYKTLDDVLQNNLNREVTGTRLTRFAHYVTGRALPLIVGGAGGYAVSGKNYIAGLGAALALERLSSSTLWNTMSATAKVEMAKAIEKGQFDTAIRIFEGAIAKQGSGLPPAPSED